LNAYNDRKENFTAPQINMWVNGYWNTTGECVCYQPNFLPPALIFSFQLLGAIW
jgi:hypothetical protein